MIAFFGNSMADLSTQLEPGFRLRLEKALLTDQATLRRLVDDLPPATEPVLDYITDLDERCFLFEEWQQLALRNGFFPLNATALAVAMVAPISEIRNFLQRIRQTQQEFELRSLLLHGVNRDLPELLRACKFVPNPPLIPFTNVLL